MTPNEILKKVGENFKNQLENFEIKGVKIKKIDSKMRMTLSLDSGGEAVIAVTHVNGGRPKGTIGLYWIVSIKGGKIFDIMCATKLHASSSYSNDVIFATTSHNFKKPTHFEVSGTSNFEEIAFQIINSIKENAIFIVEAYAGNWEMAFEYLIKSNFPHMAINPFTTCMILIHLANRKDRLDELVQIASSKPGFHDFANCQNPQMEIIEPIERWFS